LVTGSGRDEWIEILTLNYRDIMVLLIRVVLVAAIIYLLVKSFVNFFADEAEKEERREKERSAKQKGVSKEVGEYVDYEEVD